MYFEQPTIKKSVLLTTILEKATELLNSKTLKQFNCDLQSFINSLKLTNYLQPKDIFILQSHPNRIELFKRDGKGDLVFVTSFKEAEATPNIELETSQNLGNFWDFLDTKPTIAVTEHKLSWSTIETKIIAEAKQLLYCASLTIFQNNLQDKINTLKQSNHVKASHVYQLEIIGNELILFHNSLSKNDKTKVASFKMIINAKNNHVEPIEKTPIVELKPKKQIAIKPSELPPVKAIQKNNSKSINDTYAGGKNASGVYQFLINHVPPVKCIVSGFLGHCGLLKNIKPAKLMVGIDKDVLVTDRWNKENTSVKLITGDFLLNLDWVNPKQFGETLVFLDPPYLNETRANQGKLYNHEFETLEQHKTMLEKAIKFPCYVMITAYENELYNHYLDGKNGFTKHYFNGQTRGGRKQECMYINYEVPTKLHDYKFYGVDYRERWNNKKLIDRTINQLKDMPPLRRNMVIDAIFNQQF